MGLAGSIARAFRRVREPDEVRLAEEVRDWAAEIPGSVRIGDAPVREQVKLAGVVRRITIRPEGDHESLEALISDGTGEITVVWMGRRSIPGLTLGTHVVVEGLVAEQRNERRIVNPRFEFSAA
ncbi:MAG: OB-fold nucleic acid binding domain-containing protein [Actinomycetota bacterium]